MASVAAQANHVRGGKMRALVLTGDKRSHTMPEVPTLKELGIDVVAHAWWGILAPAGTPKPIIDKFHAELVKAMAAAKLDSPRGPLALNKGHNPIHNIYLRKVEGKENKVVGVAVKDLTDPPRGCKL